MNTIWGNWGLGLGIGPNPRNEPNIPNPQDFYKYFKCLNYFVIFELAYIMPT